MIAPLVYSRNDCSSKGVKKEIPIKLGVLTTETQKEKRCFETYELGRIYRNAIIHLINSDLISNQYMCVCARARDS